MTARQAAIARKTLVAVLVTLVATVAWAPRAGAGPSSPRRAKEGDCVEILRVTYVAPKTITPPDDPEKHGKTNAVMLDTRFLTTYCFTGGVWRKTKDGFPYDSAHECIGLYYNPDDHKDAQGRSTEAPDTITPLDNIDSLGHIDNAGGGYGTQNLESYCREGNSWLRKAQADDYPKGAWQDWAEECKTIHADPGASPPKQIPPPGTPDDYGDSDLKQIKPYQLQYIDPKDLPTYCRKGSVWYRVDDYPLENVPIDGLRERLQKPKNGTCVIIRYPQVADFPEVLPPLGAPGDLGGYVDKDKFEGNAKLYQTYCYSNGRWRRGDTVRGCTGGDGKVDAGGLLPDNCWGAYPSGNYDIGYDSGAWNQFDRKFTGWWTGFFYTLGKGATQVSLWAIGWAYDFDISKYDKFAFLIGNDYSTNLVDNPSFQLARIAWFVLFAWAGFTALKGKLSMAAGEIVVSIVLVALSGVLMTHRLDYMSSTWQVMDKASADLLVAGQGKDPETGGGDLSTAVNAVQRQVHKVFVEQPYDYLDWGHPLTGKCAAARDDALARGPHESDDWPRDRMKAAGCKAEADFNAKPSGSRLLGALLVMVANFVVAFVLLAVSLTVIVSKFTALLLFALAPFAALAAILPGGTRRLAWLWVTTLIQVVLAVVGMGLLLSLLLLGVQRLLEETADVGLVERFFIVNLAVLAVAMARKRLLASGQATAGRVADNLSNVRLGGGGAAWAGPSGGSGGVNLLNIDRGMEGARSRAGRGLYLAGFGAAAAVGGALAVGGRTVSQRVRERRQQQRGYRNLQRIRDWERGINEPLYEDRWTLRTSSAASQGLPAGGSPMGGPPPGGSRPAGLPPGGSRPSGMPPGGSRPAGLPPGGARPAGLPPGGGGGGLEVVPRWPGIEAARTGPGAAPATPSAAPPVWDREITITTIGRVPGIETLPHYELPRGPVERALHTWRTRGERRESARRMRDDPWRVRAAGRSVEAWMRDRPPGEWPD